MKRFLSALLVMAMVLAFVPATLVSAAVTEIITVSPDAGDNLFYQVGGLATTWTYGKDDVRGAWATCQSDSKKAQLAYQAIKLAGDWSYSVTIAPKSTENSDGRRVTRVNLLDEYYHEKVLLTYALSDSGQTWLELEFEQDDGEGGTEWNKIWDSDWLNWSDTAATITIAKTGDAEITVDVKGNAGSSISKVIDLTNLAIGMENLYYGSVYAQKTLTEFTHIGVKCTYSNNDANLYAAGVTAYENLMKNYLDAGNNRIYGLSHGYKNGDYSNKLGTMSVGTVREVWEEVVVMMAMDSHAQAYKGTAVYNEIAQRIVNSMEHVIDTLGESKITTAGVYPNHAMDDTGWVLQGLLLDYKYNTYLGNASKAARALDFAKKLFNSAYNTFYDSTWGGGMWYNANKETKSLYASTIALAGYELYQITNDGDIKTKFDAIYNGIENNLRRADGLYWMTQTGDGVWDGGSNAEMRPYDINEGGSVTYLGGNLAMAVLNARLGNTEKAKVTSEGIALFQTSKNNILINDRDAWNNTFFFGAFVREVVQTGIADDRLSDIILNTAYSILANSVFESEGYYSAAWEGPKEPSVTGYATKYNGSDIRNGWGTQDALGSYGSVPLQAMTSATTAHVLIAAAALTKTPGDFGWSTSNGTYNGWTAQDGSNFSVEYTNGDNNRVWKDLVTDPENFELNLTVTNNNTSSAYVKLLGVYLELDSRGGNGNQTFVKFNGQNKDWFACSGCQVDITITREHGGYVTFTLTGAGNAEPLVLKAEGNTDENLELGIVAGQAKFANVAAVVAEPVSPGTFGWNTDSNDFTGWTSLDGTDLTGSFNGTNNSHRLWKDLITDRNNFVVSFDVDIDNTTSVYVKLFNVGVELDGRNGNGNQCFVKLNGANQDWFSGTDCKFNVAISCVNGGSLTITLTGEGNATPLVLTASKNDTTADNLELQFYAGQGTFTNITNCALTIPAASTVLRDSLAMNFFVYQHELAGTDYEAVITHTYADGRPADVQTVPFAKWTATKLEGVPAYKFQYDGIAAKELGDSISVTVKKAGVTVCTYSDSVYAYTQRLWANTTDAALKTLIVDLLNYGAAAQKEFGYNTGALANANLSIEQQGFASSMVPSLNESRDTQGDPTKLYSFSTLSFKSELMLTFYFKSQAAGLTAKISYTNHYNLPVEREVALVANGDYYMVDVTGLAMADYKQDITVTLYNGTTPVATVIDSVESYLSRVQDSDLEDQDVYMATAKAAAAAYAYFNG